MLVAAGLIWALIGMAYAAAGLGEKAEEAAQHVIMEYGELFLFLLVAITYVNTLEERRVFDVLRVRLIGTQPVLPQPVLAHRHRWPFFFRRARQPDDGA